MRKRLVTVPQSCERLASLTLPKATITSAQTVEAGAFRPPAPVVALRRLGRRFNTLTAFCPRRATLRPTSDSDIKIEVWLRSRLKREAQAVGNGGWAGTFLSAMAPRCALVMPPPRHRPYWQRRRFCARAS